MTRMAGLVIADRFKIKRLIGIGGTGQVWEATDLQTHGLVALKILRDEVSEDLVTQARFRREADTIAALHHPGIARFVDYGHVPDPSPLGGRTVTYLATEFIRGESLSVLIHRSERLPPGRTLNVLEGVARALGHAHAAGVVHRDVKPSNILVTRDGAAKLTDFGIVRVVGEATLTHVGTVMGTARYMSPEQARGDVATAASDVYSLAVVGYEMITGTALFAGRDPLSVAMSHMDDEPAALPDAAGKPLQALIARALQKDPRRRPANGTEFAEEIAAARQPIRPQARSTGDRVPATTRMLRRLKGLHRR
ncbi:serine/threonine protein kinase [Mycolicibacterium sp. P1-18]|uniref:serine/threonine-protein kinase n=1 Tax=Mycolicibacterium sp. P1-18 TaxID=2024615 RepID=UPI0011F1D2AC|nr:serine/threonine-protein kinase [Mycolicibacterium sp. P1-18]KAA0101062.1 serine/threonine protein kinase [Mycolicibacterium sp. P1-18]